MVVLEGVEDIVRIGDFVVVVKKSDGYVEAFNVVFE
jgi:hypothetical protein